MIQAIIDDICTELTGVPGVMGEVLQHAGDLDALIAEPKRLPALWVVYDGADFTGRDTVGDDRAEHIMRVSVVLLATSHRSRADAAVACYPIIEAVRNRLTAHQVDNYGDLWPEREKLVVVEGPLVVYAMTYAMNTEHVVS